MSAAESRAVFLSYASQDAEAARRICEALRAVSIEVWFDQSELRGGDTWDQKIRREVRACSLFMPVISANTQARREGYFRREWNLACDRLLDMTRGTTFLLPVVVDGTSEREALVPEEFLRVQWTRIAGGDSLDPFCARVKILLDGSVTAAAVGPRHPGSMKSAAGVPAPSEARPPAPATSSIRRPRWRVPVIAIGSLAVLVAVAAGWWFSRQSPTPPAPQTLPATVAPVAEVRTFPLTANMGWEGQPTFSPDGNHIAYTWNGERQDNFDLYVKQIGAGAPLRLTSNPAPEVSPVWSPDGRWIAFLRGPPTGRAAVVLIPPLGGAERVVGELANVGTFVRMKRSIGWTTDGKWLIIAGAAVRGEASGLFLLSLESGELRRLAQGAAHSPVLSPNGRRLAFVQTKSLDTGDLQVLELSHDFAPQGEVIRLTTLFQGIGNPMWTADGRELIFSAGAHMAPRSLWRVTATAGSTSRRERIGEDSTSIANSPTAQRFAYAREALDADIWRLTLRSRAQPAGPPLRFISSIHVDANPEYSRDGKRIVFNSHRSGAQEVWIANVDGTNALQVSNAAGPMVANPRWSPDERAIAVQSMRGGTRGLDVISASGGAFTRLLDGSVNWPTWSRDGKWLYFGAGGQLRKMPREGGAAIQVTQQGGNGMAFESADGRFLFYVKGFEGGEIRKLPLNGGPEVRVTSEPLSYGMNVAFADDGFYFVSAATGESDGRLLFYEFASGAVTRVLAIPRWGFGLGLSPDGKEIVYSQWAEDRSSLIVVENFR